MRIGIDAGGTFTDFIVLHDDGRLESFKLKSNPKSPAAVILSGIDRASSRKRVDIVHGSTVATNALLERNGARTAFVTTAGFEDLVHIGRQNRRELYNLTPVPRVPLVPRELCFGVKERVYFDGVVEAKPTAAEISRLARKLKRAGARSVAICFLHAYQFQEHEQMVRDALRELGYVCASHEVSPEFREYERASTTVINAYVGPLMDTYLGELERSSRHRISILQSNGGLLSAAEARKHAVRTILSGPAGGAIGAVEMARRSGFRKILGFDMGGTSTDVCLCEGAPKETTESSIDGFPIRVPMLDIHTVGAGGGSIARVDGGGLLRVGPESAGADPGPACYGIGDLPTVTDAQVVLGRIASSQFLGGEMKIDDTRSAKAVTEIGKALRINAVAAAEGIIRVANANMERAIRTVSIERGHDPREFALVAFGGGGGLHACELADSLGMKTVIVPRYAEGLSALGMLLADQVRDYATGVIGRTDFDRRYRDLERRARKDVRGAELARTADLRYSGQSYELTVTWKSHAEAERQFHRAHQRIYGYSVPDRAVDVVTLRVRARVAVAKPRFPRLGRQPAPRESRYIYLNGRRYSIAVWKREQLSGTWRKGPALILDYGSTTLVPPRWKYRVDGIGNLIVGH